MRPQPGTVLIEGNRITIFVTSATLPKEIHLAVAPLGRTEDYPLVTYHRDDTTTGIWKPEQEAPQSPPRPEDRPSPHRGPHPAGGPTAHRVPHDDTDSLDELFAPHHAPVPPHVRERWSFETATRTGTLCSVCYTPQVKSPGGDTCESGEHGGADPATCGQCHTNLTMMYGFYCPKCDKGRG